MKLSIKSSGIMQDFARALGARVSGRFLHIPEDKGRGYMTGFSWGSDLRMMIRNYHLKEEIFLEWKNDSIIGKENLAFRISGILPSLSRSGEQLSTEQASILICRQAVSSVIAMPSNTIFGSVTIAASREYLQQLFGHIDHPVVAGVLAAGENLVLETGISPGMIDVAGALLNQPVPGPLESQYYKLKCDELLCHIFGILMQREATPAAAMHIDDIKAIYAVKSHLQSHLDEPPNIAALARQAGMSEPKLRRLFKQTFGKGIFDYYQSGRMQRAAQLLREKRLSVSEVGYEMGFTNLSHFSRVFEQYIGIKPKKYSASHTLG